MNHKSESWVVSKYINDNNPLRGVHESRLCHSNSLRRVKITKTVDFCITRYKKRTQVDMSTARHEWVN